ncbi:MAG TPA: YeeE/YedE thiosulfate transporter family protein [Gemmatimonadaceae bacterium]
MTPRPYMDGARAGIALGLVLLASFVLAGRGIGASGAFAVAAAPVAGAVTPGSVAGSTALSDRLPREFVPWNDWIVLELLGVLVGAGISARLSGRWRAATNDRTAGRVSRALAGGALMGLGARLAWGCTSGLALSGGALLSTGAWLFIPLAFGTAILVTMLARDPSLGT